MNKLNDVRGKIIPGQYLVQFKERVTGSPEVVARQAYGIRGAMPFGEKEGSRGVRGFAAHLENHELQQLASDPNVMYVEPDQMAIAFRNAHFGQPAVKKQEMDEHHSIWHLDRLDQKGDALRGTYRYRYDGEGVTCYIFDTGIDVNHPEFGGRASHGINVTTSPSADRDGHGTHVAGVVGGSTYGVAKACRLINTKVLGDDGFGSYSGIIRALDHVLREAAFKPAVINMSLGGGRSQILNEAIERCVEAGIVVVVAAGNENTDAGIVSPASAPRAITVGASTRRDHRASFSNFGAFVDIYAPGTNVLSSLPNGRRAAWSGTSMAAPSVAGVCAQLIQRQMLKGSYRPDVTQVTKELLDLARPDRVKNNPAGTANLLLASPV